MKRIGIILNESSGGINRYEEIEALTLNYLDQAEFVIKEKFEELLPEKFDIIVGAGGDGTLNAVAKHLVGTEMCFGILPIGTLNHLAKDLKIPLKIDEALKLIIDQPEIMNIDVGICNDKTFLNNSGLGIYPEIVRARENLQKDGHVKWWALILASIKTIRKIPTLRVKIKVDGNIIEKKTAFLFVGNNIYGLGGLSTGSRNSLSDGKLSLWISHRTSPWGLVILLLHAIFGNVREHRDFDVYETDRAYVEIKRGIASISLDGEVEILNSPLEYTIKPKSLRIIVPTQIENI